MRRRVSGLVVVAVALLALVASLTAQAPVTSTDILQLETTADDVARQIASLRKTDAALAADLEKKLADVREDITYLKVKLRRDGAVTRTEYLDTRDKLDRLRTRAHGDNPPSAPATASIAVSSSSSRAARQVPAGAEFDVRLHGALDTALARSGDKFAGETLMDFKIGDEVVVPAGSEVRGFVASVRGSGKIDSHGSFTLAFEAIAIGAASARLRASVAQVLDGKALAGRGLDDLSKLDLGAAAGAVIGTKMTLAGVFVDSQGSISSTEGRDVLLPEGTILRIRLDQPVDVPAIR